jgi:hypothetical protein
MEYSEILPDESCAGIPASGLRYCGTLEHLKGVWAYWDGYGPEDAPGRQFEYDCVFDGAVVDQYQLGPLIRGNTFLTALALAEWLFENYDPGETAMGNEEENAAGLLERYRRGNGFNCRQFAKILCQLLLSLGIRSRILYLEPFNPGMAGDHVVTLVWSPEFQKWWMVDPTLNTHFVDADAVPLDAWEIRSAAMANERIWISKGSERLATWGMNDADRFLYYCRNIFSMGSPRFSGRHATSRETVWLIPQGFDFRKRALATERIAYRKTTAEADAAVDFPGDRFTHDVGSFMQRPD